MLPLGGVSLGYISTKLNKIELNKFMNWVWQLEGMRLVRVVPLLDNFSSFSLKIQPFFDQKIN